MKKTSNPLLLDSDKQRTPMAGEVSPENARLKAIAFAAQEKARLEKGRNKAKSSPV